MKERTQLAEVEIIIDTKIMKITARLFVDADVVGNYSDHIHTFLVNHNANKLGAMLLSEADR